jgi:hypothetical protein
MRPNTVQSMNRFMLALTELLETGEGFGGALSKFSKAYYAYQRDIWLEGYYLLREVLEYRKPMCRACGCILSAKGNCTSIHCSREHDRIES